VNIYISGLIAVWAGVAAQAQVASTGVVAAASNMVAGATNAAVAVTNAASTAATSTPLSTTSGGGSGWLSYAIWGAVIVGIFAFLWTKGYLVRMRNYVEETQEELKKCSWPSRDELKGSTVVVMVTILLLGGFTVGVDFILSKIMALIT
jgi:preprotein translocase SecE subunit